MPLPSDPQMVWPPQEDAKVREKYAEWAAWYSGDPQRLADFYGGQAVTTLQQSSQVLNQSPWWKFWSRTGRQTYSTIQRAQLHVPLAGDLAAVNAALLFGEEPRVKIAAAHGKTPDTSAVATEVHLNQRLEDGGIYNRLIEAAETAAAMGGVYLMPFWDKGVVDFPILSIAQVDQACPRFAYGVLQEVIFWEDVLVDGHTVFRHLECHESAGGYGGSTSATIRHGLYKGTTGMLGERIALTQNPHTQDLADEVVLPFPELDVQYIPNMRPNRLWRTSSLGQSDYSGSELLLDALDETYASWMRDVRLGKARIMVPQEYLDVNQRFDVDHEVFTTLNMEPSAAQQGARAIESKQFEIRFQQHEATILNIVERIVDNAGYSPQTFGLRIEGRAESGTALRIRENRTYLTQKRKGHWWRPAIQKVLEQLLILDMQEFGAAVEPFPVEVDLADSMPDDMTELGGLVNALKQAQAASIETRVKLVHPEWAEEQVQAEVERIKEEEGIGVMPSPELPGFGTGATPPQSGAEGGAGA